MFQVKKKKELEGFGKNRKRNTIIIASILGILIVVGIVTLFRTFAFFEEKREFNVIRGRIPDFSKVATTDETADGLYSMEDDYGTSYYFRGATENNYIKFT